jgi:hypothetical protein
VFLIYINLASFSISEKAITVPEQLDRFIARKHFLHASDLLVETGICLMSFV